MASDSISLEAVVARGNFYSARIRRKVNGPRGNFFTVRLRIASARDFGVLMAVAGLGTVGAPVRLSSRELASGKPLKSVLKKGSHTRWEGGCVRGGE